MAEANEHDPVKASAILACLALLSCLSARATVTLNVDAADLRTANGSELMSTNGLILLVASTNDLAFGGPTATSFVTGDDVVLFRTDLSSLGEAGFFQGVVNISLSSFPGLEPGDPVQLYWFPTLNVGSSSPGAGTTYGYYRHDTGLDGSAAWVIPGDGSLVDLKFLTVSQGGSNPNTLGYANHVNMVPPPTILSLSGPGTSNTVVSWSAVSNFTYRVRYRPDFNSAWINLIPDVTATNSVASLVDNPGTAPQRFYQVLLVQ